MFKVANDTSTSPTLMTKNLLWGTHKHHMTIQKLLVRSRCVWSIDVGCFSCTPQFSVEWESSTCLANMSNYILQIEWYTCYFRKQANTSHCSRQFSNKSSYHGCPVLVHCVHQHWFCWHSYRPLWSKLRQKEKPSKWHHAHISLISRPPSFQFCHTPLWRT